MRRSGRLLAIALFGLAWPVPAQVGQNGLMERLASVQPETASAADCEAQVGKAQQLNGPDLLYAASVCFAADKQVEGAFMLSAGQTRSVADMLLMVPASKADSDIATSLYGVIYFYAGGFGSDDVLRNPTWRDRLLRLLDNWSPAFGPDHDPGWKVRRRPQAAKYAGMIAESKANRRKQLVEVAQLLSDDTYYALHQRHNDLLKRNQNRFVEGTPEAKLSEELLRGMNERAVALGVRVPPVATGKAASSAAEPRFPTISPAKEERVLSNSTDPTIQRCAELAEQQIIADESRILRLLVTQSPEWGVIWRADLGGPGKETRRFTCSQNTSSSQPLGMRDPSIAPLPESGTTTSRTPD